VLALCASCPPLYCPGATRGGRGVRYARMIIIIFFQNEASGERKGGRGVRYARTIFNAHHVSYGCMQPPCARLVRIMSPTVLPRPRRTLRSHGCQRASRKLIVQKVFKTRPRAKTLAGFLAQPRPPGASTVYTVHRGCIRSKQ
jgi:hypothetical protein